jgi:acetylornithine/succinyldiaminopimelate/putrescine aminotransferase
MVIPEKGYLARVREKCDETGAVLILDETQTGLGRTGKIWGADHFHVVPDILVTAKGPSGGIYPITATCFRPHLEKTFHSDPFILIGSTYGGSELGCVVFSRVLDICTAPDFLDHVNHMAALFTRGFHDLKETFPDIITGFNQLGLFMSLRMRDASYGMSAMKACYDNGLLCFFANNDTAYIQVLPALIITEDEVSEVFRRFEKAFLQIQN